MVGAHAKGVITPEVGGSGAMSMNTALASTMQTPRRLASPAGQRFAFPSLSRNFAEAGQHYSCY